MSLPKELLTARPRPGGHSIQINDTSSISIPAPRELHEIDIEGKNTTPSRRYRINQVVTSTPWNYIKAKEKEGEVKPNTLESAMKLLSVTVSTIMLLATNSGNISKSNLKWAYNYLHLIKDEFGQNPPNVQGILNHIQHVSGGVDFLIKKDANTQDPTNLETNADEAAGSPKDSSPEETSPEDAD